MLIVPLVTGITSAIDRAGKVRAQAGEVSDGTAKSTAGAAWEWGLSAVSVRWEAGPALCVEVEGRDGVESIVGLWVDGWFRGELSPDDSEGVEVPTSEWSGETGSEVVIRVREAQGVWGPPWRSIVPARDYDPAGSTTTGRRAKVGDGATTGSETVIHVPALATPPLEVSRSDVPLEVDLLGLLFELSPTSWGICEVTLGKSIRSWKTEEGRALDMYF